jgi:hypothetical protein
MALSHHSDRECNAGKQLFTPTFERRVLVVLPRFSSILIRNRLSNCNIQGPNVTEAYQPAKSAAVEAWSALVMV